MHLVRCGFFNDFKGNDTLLLDATTKGCEGLAILFRELAATPNKEIVLTDQDFVTQCDSVHVTAANLFNTPTGVRFVSKSMIVWNASSKIWTELADSVSELVKSNPGHQYLEGADCEVSVAISVGEYGNDFWWEKL